MDPWKFITTWRNESENNNVILMMDANEKVSEESELTKFVNDYDLVDSVPTCNPPLILDLVYIDENKRVNYIFISPT